MNEQDELSRSADGAETSFEEDSLTRSYERDDERYQGASQLRDWIILFVIGALHFLWMFLVFLYEPGIR